MLLRSWAALIAVGALAGFSPRMQMSTSQPAYPEAQIANEHIRARVYLPDAQRGFYRSTRFDWSGVIGSLQYQGHEFYHPWFAGVDPPVRDFVYRNGEIVVGAQSAMVGPAEEFRTALGYEAAPPGGTFVKIGVGVLRKPDAARYSAYANYEIVDSGRWSVQTRADAVETAQELNDAASGYGYVYRKVVRLAPGKPELVLDHSLRNTGRLPIRTKQYNHNFLVLDRAPTGPDFTIALPFEIQASPAPDPELAAIEGRRIVYRRRLDNEDRVFFGIQGHGAEARDYDIRIENRALGAGVRITGDRPLASISLWSIRSVISIEPDVDVNLEPGAAMNWSCTYTYYTVPRTD